jgi:ABC-2 type transport system ATP-binding protein
VAGFDVFTESLEVRKRIGYLPEKVPIYKDMTVERYLDFVARLKGVSAGSRRKEIDRVKESCGVRDVAGRFIGNLSRGYTQRVGIAQALLGDPEVLILDEPTVGLDPKQIVEIRNLIRGLAGKKTVILSTHILPEVNMICDSVAIINKGRIISKDSISRLGAEPQMRIHLTLQDAPQAGSEAEVDVISLLSSVPGVQGVGKGDGPGFEVLCEPGADPRAELSAAVVGRGLKLVELRLELHSLEDIFIKATAHEEAGQETEEETGQEAHEEAGESEAES